jgi:radical SAM superfamily enzyme YgiQ (UPF0313 family)
MKVTFIYAGIGGCGFNSYRSNEASWINHGLAILASVMKQKGYAVDLIDLRRLTGWQHFRQIVKNGIGEIAAITMMSVDYDHSTKAAKIIKEFKPETKIIVGGPHPSICPEELEDLEFIDCIVKGEGEITLPKLAASLKKGESLPKVVQGIPLENLDESPWADRDLFKSLEKPFVPFLKKPFVTLIAGRGCRYNCNFCQPAERIMFGRKVRRRSVSNFIEELKYLRKRYNFNSFMIHDDCITEDRKWIMEFCEEYKSAGFKLPFVAQSRADIICNNRDMVRALREIGLELFLIGFESGSDRVLKSIQKGCTRNQNLEAARICKEEGIKIWANYMLGLPTETNQEALETLSMLEQIKPYRCSPAFYTPHPGSKLYEVGQKNGIHLINDHASYRRSKFEPKIKGPDYKFLSKVLYKSMATAQKDYSGMPFSEKIKNKLTQSSLKIPALYSFLKMIQKDRK